jgi:sugar phosphate isomerase/epimerase
MPGGRRLCYDIGMKYAFMSFSCPERSFDELLSTAKQYSYDGIEPRIESRHAHGVEMDTVPADRAVIRRKAEDSGIAICCMATSRKYADPATAEHEVALTLNCIDLAADIGSPRIRVFGGQIPGGLSRQAAIELLAKSLGSVANHARERGVTVCLETHDDWRNPADIAAVMALVNDEAIAVNWDIMHPVRHGHSMDEAFNTLRPWIRHVHFHDGILVEGKGKLVPIGEGEINHRRAVELLQSVSYDGYLSGEWINWEPCDLHLPRELATIRSYEPKQP